MTDTPALTITAPIERLAPDTIRLTRLLDATPEVVWDYLTRAELRRTWFMDGEDAPAAGGSFAMVVNHDNLSSDDVPYPAEYADSKGARWTDEVLRYEPPRLLETTFASGNQGTVTYELHPEGNKTRLVLTHRGVVSPTGSQDFGGGWNSHMIVLQERLAGRSVRDFWSLHARSRAAVAEALG